MPDQPAPKTLHQQTVDYTVQAIAQREARLAAQDLLVLDLRSQLSATLARVTELEALITPEAVADNTDPPPAPESVTPKPRVRRRS